MQFLVKQQRVFASGECRIVGAAHTDLGKREALVKIDRLPVRTSDFKQQPSRTRRTGFFDDLLQQPRAMPLPLMATVNAEIEQMRLIEHRHHDREADDFTR